VSLNELREIEETIGWTPPLVPLRFLLAFLPVITSSARQFCLDAGVCGEELERLEDAWAKAPEGQLEEKEMTHRLQSVDKPKSSFR
jgi:hypothetical protein